MAAGLDEVTLLEETRICHAVAALYDIHGNPPALEAVLQGRYVEHKSTRSWSGATWFPGPMSRETLACLVGLDIPIQFIEGNCEVAVLAEMGGAEPDWYAPFRPRLEKLCTGRRNRFRLLNDCSAAGPRRFGSRSTGSATCSFAMRRRATKTRSSRVLTAEDRLLPVFDGLGVLSSSAATPTCSSIAWSEEPGSSTRGSVGCHSGPPGAFWLQLGPDVELRQASTRSGATVERIRATNYPQAQEFAHPEWHPAA